MLFTNYQSWWVKNKKLTFRESTLKPRESIPVLNKNINDNNSIGDLKFTIEVDPPNNDIYKVEGTVILNDKKHNFDIKNILLRVSFNLNFRVAN